jgi:hypothetical protein
MWIARQRRNERNPDMTSPVDTSVKLLWSGMSNVPVLNGQAGSLLGILNAGLVTGCDIKALTSLTVTGGIATATFAGQHSALVDSVILREGVSGALATLNGEQKVTARPNANALTFATTEPDGAAEGAITIKLAPAGWIKPFASGNVAVYASADAQSLGMLLRVDDTGTTNARVVGYEQMLDINTGSGPFPSASMVAGGGYWNKSSLAGAAAVPWVLAADRRMALLWMASCVPSNAANHGGCVYAFGDAMALRPGGDAWAAIVSCDTGIQALQGGIESGNTGKLAVARSYSGLGAALWYSSYPYTGGTGTALSGNDATLGPFPNTMTGELYFSRRFIASATGASPRADLPGLYTVPQSGLLGYFNTGSTVAAGGTLLGRNLFALRAAYSWNVTPYGVVFIDQTGPWR